MPTGVGVMQEGQIGRPQEEQETRGLAVGMSVTGLRHRNRAAYNRAPMGGEQEIQGRDRARRDSTRRWSARRWWSLGIVGFFYSSSFGSPGRGRRRPRALRRQRLEQHRSTSSPARVGSARRRLRRAPLRALDGHRLLAIAVWGFVLGGGEAILGLFPVDTGVDVLHLALGLLGVGAGSGVRLGPDPLGQRAQAALPGCGPGGASRAGPGRRWRRCRRRPRPPGAPSCAGRAARAARSRRAASAQSESSSAAAWVIAPSVSSPGPRAAPAARSAAARRLSIALDVSHRPLPSPPGAA